MRNASPRLDLMQVTCVRYVVQTVTLNMDTDIFPETGELLSGIGEALADSLKNFSFTPLLKQELKTKIQISRLKRGKEELKVNFEPKPSYELREEEIHRQSRRREVNRIAALKFRQKKKDYVQKLKERERQLEEENKKLEAELQQWRDIHETQQMQSVKSLPSPQATSNNDFVWVLIGPET